MKTVSTTQLRQHLQSCLAAVRAGESVQITSHGRVVARLEPATGADADAQAASRRRLLGSVLQHDEPLAPALAHDEWRMHR